MQFLFIFTSKIINIFTYKQNSCTCLTQFYLIPKVVALPKFHCITSICFYPKQEEIKAWVVYQKKKWGIQARQRKEQSKRRRLDQGEETGGGGVIRGETAAGLGGFLRRKARSMIDLPWQIVHVSSR